MGPVEGLVSQNWVCRSWPPGALKQQVLATFVVLWQLNCVELETGHESGVPARESGLLQSNASEMVLKVKLATERIDGKAAGILMVK